MWIFHFVFVGTPFIQIYIFTYWTKMKLKIDAYTTLHIHE